MQLLKFSLPDISRIADQLTKHMNGYLEATNDNRINSGKHFSCELLISLPCTLIIYMTNIVK